MNNHHPSVKNILERARAERRAALSAADCAELCRAYEIPVPPQALASSAADAIRVAAEIGYPVAMKISSPEIQHKTEVGGVALNLGEAAAVETSFKLLSARAKGSRPEATLEGVLVQKMVLAGGIELIVGASTDP